jgi:hypothetical protein
MQFDLQSDSVADNGRALPVSFGIFVLVLLLASTTPIGTGAGIHQLVLMHPLFEHIHVLNGRVVTHDTQPLAPRTGGPAIAAGAPGDSLELGIGAASDVPWMALAVSQFAPTWRWLAEPLRPTGRADTPPDPPPIPTQRALS